MVRQPGQQPHGASSLKGEGCGPTAVGQQAAVFLSMCH